MLAYKGEPRVFCPVVGFNGYKKDCLAIQCPYHAFWNGRYKGGYECEYHVMKKEERGGSSEEEKRLAESKGKEEMERGEVGSRKRGQFRGYRQV